MSLYGVPFLLANIGAQTVYVIDQRLRDQSIPVHKAQRILCDICAVLFSESLWDQVITPQEIYTAESTRSVLEKIVHSSLIKLNDASMTKLYDLTQMVFKHQILVCSKPSALWLVTKKHIETLQSLVPPLRELKECSRSIARFAALSESFTGSEWLKLRQTLLEFLRDKKVKITMLMKDNYQSSEGEIASLNRPEDVDSVGSVSIQRFQTLKKGQKRVSSHPLPLPAYTDAAKRKRMIVAPEQIVCNLYAHESKASGSGPSSPFTASSKSAKQASDAAAAAAETSTSPSRSPQSPRSRGAQAAAAATTGGGGGGGGGSQAMEESTGIDGGVELNSLAAMIGANKRDNTQTPSKLSIFADNIVVDEQGEDYQPPETIQAVKLVEDFVLEAKNLAARQSLEKVVNDLDLAPPQQAAEADDLLDLMDLVS